MPSTPGEVEPPSISGTPAYGHALSSWTGSPTLTNIWVLSSYQLGLTGSKLGSSFTTVLTQVGSRPTYPVPISTPAIG